MRSMKTLDAILFAAAVIGSLVLLNVMDLRLFRSDMTESQMYTLSPATIKILKDLDDPVTVRAYITRDLPPPWSATSRYVQDMLEEYFSQGGGYFRFEVVDPSAEETEEDKQKKKEIKRDVFNRLVREKTSVEQELEQLGIVSFPAGRIDADSKEVKRAYMGLVVSRGDKQEVIPRIQTDPRGLEHARNFEYELTMLIRKVSRTQAPKVALITGHGNPELNPSQERPAANSMGRVHATLKEQYDVSTIDLTKKAEIGDDIEAILVVGPTTAFSEDEKRAIDAFIMSGRNAAFMLGPVSPNLQMMMANPTQHGLGDLLATYGVTIEPGLVLDTEAGRMTFMQRRGNMTVQQQVPYPFVLLRKKVEGAHPLTRGLGGVVMPFVGPLAAPEEETENGVRADVVLRSSPSGWIHTEPYDLNPQKRWTRDEAGEMEERTLMVALSGPLLSHYTQPEGDQHVDGQTRAANARVLVAGGHAFMLDQFLAPGNQALVLNMMDWLVTDEAMMAVRARGLQPALLDSDLSDGTKDLVKYANILGLPMAFVLLGLLRWRFRESRRKRARI